MIQAACDTSRAAALAPEDARAACVLPRPSGTTLPALRLRARTPQDTPFLRRLYGEVRAEELAGVSWPEAMKQAFLDDQFRLQERHYAGCGGDACFQIVVAGRRPVGRLYTREDAGTLHVMDLSLCIAARGRGIGTAVLGHVLALAGGRAVTLSVAAGNPAARLYGRLGFQPEGAPDGLYQRMRREGGPGEA